MPLLPGCWMCNKFEAKILVILFRVTDDHCMDWIWLFCDILCKAHARHLGPKEALWNYVVVSGILVA